MAPVTLDPEYQPKKEVRAQRALGTGTCVYCRQPTDLAVEAVDVVPKDHRNEFLQRYRTNKAVWHVCEENWHNLEEWAFGNGIYIRVVHESPDP
jgi:hypothetical protein